MGRPKTTRPNERLEEFFRVMKEAKRLRTKKEMAELLEFNYSHLSEIFSGAKPLTMEFALRLRTAFGVNERWLVHADGQMMVPIDGMKLTTDTPVDDVGRLIRIVETLTETNRKLSEENQKLLALLAAKN